MEEATESSICRQSNGEAPPPHPSILAALVQVPSDPHVAKSNGRVSAPIPPAPLGTFAPQEVPVDSCSLALYPPLLVSPRSPLPANTGERQGSGVHFPIWTQTHSRRF